MEAQSSSKMKYWWLELLLGILFILFGFWIIRTPLETYVALAILFSVTFFVSGIVEISFSLSHRKAMKGYGWYLAGGILDIFIGLVLMTHLDITMAVLPYVVSFWVMFKSIMAIAAAIEAQNKGIKNWGWTLVFGILGLLLAFIMVWNPLLAGLTLVYYTAFAFFSMGIFKITLAFHFKSEHHHEEHSTTAS